MREILFRGKRRDNGEWIEGFIGGLHCFKTDDETGEITRIDSYYLNHQSVDANTVGQYTGLTDKNGKKIFEGDIIHYLYTPGEGFWNADEICEVKFEGTGFYIECIHNNQFARHSGWLIQIPYGKDKSGNVCEFEVIGNIHDNPELLGGISNEKNN